MKIFGLFAKKTNNYYDSKEFYKTHPDLMPRNVYLQEGRVIDMKNVRKTLADFDKNSLVERIETFFDKILGWLKSGKK